MLLANGTSANKKKKLYMIIIKIWRTLTIFQRDVYHPKVYIE
jgi:hypothetical protein